jgi:hypothetical protein
MNTININGKDYTTEELTKILEDAKELSPIDKVYAFHKTTKEEFDKLYEKLPLRSKYLEVEVMIVAYKNNGWKHKYGDTAYYPYFHISPFSFYGVNYYQSYSTVPLTFCFKNEKVCEEAVEEFKEEYKLSRTTL